MRKLLAGVLLVIALGSLAGLIASFAGVQVGEGGRPMLFARGLVLSVVLLLVVLRWGRRAR